MISDRPPRAAPFADVDTWVFDLDNTLYPARYNLFELVERNIGTFVAELLGVDRGAARRGACRKRTSASTERRCAA